MSTVVEQVEKFVAEEFEKHPHYSFNDWTVMRDHSFKVRDIALKIGEGMNADTTVIAIGALLHDIGKTYEADADTLHTKHEDFNLPVSENLIDSLDLTEEQKRLVKEIVEHRSDSVEMQIIEDADALALYADKKLYTLFIAWAKEKGLTAAIQRKLDKFDRLHFPKSKEIGSGWYEEMKRDWGY